ncbi:hypothetical protein [Dactylosporangium sp. CA-092794]|uniref:hypothetical protein n=1 Tax=Dactylosporangium sp. CA-092794 TaxID=3239929 RepID=UPI003D89ECA9
MRDKMLGRWMVRLAVTAGVGAFALGVSSIAAHASDLSQRAVQASQARALTLIGSAQLAKAAPDQIYVTEDYAWD